jgi:YidC/Oxa1 family membrane protein insertase
MNPFLEIYNLIFYQPISQVLSFFYQHLKDLGLAVIFLTVLIRALLLPLEYKNLKEQEKFHRIRKGIEEIEKKFNGERKKEEISALYQKEKVNPFFSLLSLTIQFPVLVALYQVFLKATNQFNPSFLGIFDLSKPNLLLVLITLFFQLLYLNLTSTQNELKKTIPISSLNFFFIPFIFFILIRLPSALSLYLIITYLFLIFQRFLFHG